MRGNARCSAQAAEEAKAAAAAAALARGKRGKAKKAKEKYMHQDEEDRQLALQFLAPAGWAACAFIKNTCIMKRVLYGVKKLSGMNAVVWDDGKGYTCTV